MPPCFRETHDCLQLDPRGQAYIPVAWFRHPWLKWRTHIHTALETELVSGDTIVLGMNSVRRMGHGLNWTRGRIAPAQTRALIRRMADVPEDTLRQFAHKPFALVQSAGRGQVIAFTENPYYRGFTKGLAPLLFNACFLGPAHTEK